MWYKLDGTICKYVLLIYLTDHITSYRSVSASFSFFNSYIIAGHKKGRFLIRSYFLSIVSYLPVFLYKEYRTQPYFIVSCMVPKYVLMSIPCHAKYSTLVLMVARHDFMNAHGMGTKMVLTPTLASFSKLSTCALVDL